MVMEKAWKSGFKKNELLRTRDEEANNYFEKIRV